MPILISFLILVFIYGAISDIEECRNQRLCENGGTCLLSSDLPVGKKCEDDEIYHMEYCYSFNEFPMSWSDAARYCHDKSRVLALTETDDDQTFYAGYVQGMLAATQAYTQGVTGVWTSVRSVPNLTEPAWVIFPGSYVVERYYWQPGEPTIYPNYDDICVSLQQDSIYRNWVAQPCDVKNHVVCKRKAVDQDASKKRMAQCMCPEQFGGIRCEERTDEIPAQNLSCASAPFEFACRDGGTIHVEYASYGAVEGYICNQNMVTAVQTCSNPNSLKTITNKCQGLSFCSIQELKSLFPETSCPVQEEIFLHYRFRCSEDNPRCASGAFYMSGRCFVIDTKRKRLPQIEAQQACRKEGGYLASNIDSSMDAELTRQVVRQSKDEDAFWIDLKVNDEGIPEWSDGSSLTYRPSEAAISVRDSCVAYVVSGGRARWTSRPCAATANYLCAFTPVGVQRSQEEVPAPTEEPKIVFQGSRIPSAVGEIFGPAKYCNAETRKGILYPKTRACTEARISCPDPENIIGTITRYCNCETTKWEMPNTTNCTHKWVVEMRSAIERGDPAEQITTKMAADLDSTLSRQLYGGDIIGSVSVTGDVLSLARSQYDALDNRIDRQAKAANFTESFGLSGDYLLSPRALPVWEELTSSLRVDHASVLMSSLERSAILLADYTLDQQKKLQYSNWAMEIDVRQPETITPQEDSADISPDSADFSPNATHLGPRVGGPLKSPPPPLDDHFRPAVAPASPAATTPSPAPTVQFSGFSQSPIITLPSLSVLKLSSKAASAAPSSAVFFHPGVRSKAVSRRASGFFVDSARVRSRRSEFGQPASTSLDRSRLRLGYYVFTTFGQLLNHDTHTIVNSHVIGASVDDATRSLSLPDDQPATFTFYHLKKNGVSNPRCVFWNLDTREWSTEGCRLISTSDELTECACTHLTSFAILMDVSGKVSQYDGSMAAALDVVSIIGCALSVVCLALSLFVFTFFRSLYNVRNTIHRNLCFSLLVAELVFVIGMDRTADRVGCSIVALLLHYFFLAAFCWMLLEGYQLYLMLIQVFEPDKTRILLYYLFSYGFPAVVVGVSAGVAWHNYGTDRYCWINTSSPTLWTFIVPVIVVVLANVIFLVIALRVVLSVRSRDRNRTDKIFGWLKGSATLLCLLGVTWIFGFLTAVGSAGGVVFAWIFTILNCLQGVFIFILHVILNEKVRLTIVRWLRSGVCCLPDKTSADNSREYISSRHRIMNMVKANYNSGSTPDTASTDDKEKQMTPTSKTQDWLRRLTAENQEVSPLSSPQFSDDVEPSTEDRISSYSDPRGSQLDGLGDPVGKQAPVKRKKFPLGATEHERGSKHVVVERF